MKLSEAYTLEAFGKTSESLWSLIKQTPDEVLKKMYDVWAKKKIEEIEVDIKKHYENLESIHRGLEL
jgi:hypothetical protein